MARWGSIDGMPPARMNWLFSSGGNHQLMARRGVTPKPCSVYPLPSHDTGANSRATFAELCDAITERKLAVFTLVGGHSGTDPVAPVTALAQALDRPTCRTPR